MFLKIEQIWSNIRKSTAILSIFVMVFSPFIGGKSYANLLVNGDFNGSTTGWTEIGNIFLLSSDCCAITAVDGSYFLDLTGTLDYQQQYGGVSQSIATVSGSAYHLSFFGGNYSANSNTFLDGAVGFLATAGATQQSFNMLWPPSGFVWTEFGMDFVASGPSTTISIVGTAGGSYIGLDAVSVMNAASSAVPEPATFGLLGLAAGALGMIRRRRR